MPEFNKKQPQKIDIDHKISSDSLKSSISKLRNSDLIKYAQRQVKRREQERAASEKYHEISEASKSKTRLKDANAPKNLQEKSTEVAGKVKKYLKAHKKPRDERSLRRIKPKHLLWILVVLCVALIVLTGVSERFRTPFKTAASILVVPAQKGVNSIGLWLSDKMEAQKTLNELEEENQQLKDIISDLTLTISELKQKEQELDRLQELVKLRDDYPEYDMVGAHIIAKYSGKWFSTFTVDKGSNDGIRKDMNVIASGGLVGIVIDVGENFATVRSIIDDESSVSGKFEDTAELCMINGSLPLMDQNLLSFSDVGADIMITVNTAVVTSHVSSKYLPGLLIGYVKDYQLDGNNLTQSGHLQPVVDFSNLEEVMIITTLKGISD